MVNLGKNECLQTSRPSSAVPRLILVSASKCRLPVGMCMVPASGVGLLVWKVVGKGRVWCSVVEPALIVSKLRMKMPIFS